MSFSSTDRIGLYIDGANLIATARALGFDVDFRRLLHEFRGCGRLLQAVYYTVISEDQAYSTVRPLLDWFDYNGYTVITKATKEFLDPGGSRRVKGNIDHDLAVHAIEFAKQIDQMVLFSGDGNLRAMVGAVQRRGVRVTVISTISSEPPMIADSLRRQADVFIDFIELKSRLGREEPARLARSGTHQKIQIRTPTVMRKRSGDRNSDGAR
jgi:uncharacterized LabA/DUF88 family protein